METNIDVIIADDNKQYRQGLVSLLSTFNIRTVAEAANGLELIDLLKEKKPDVILLDIQMPVLDGDEALTIITKKFMNTSIIVITQYDEAELIKNYILRGAKGFVTKNSGIEVLVEAIRNVRAYGFYFDNIREVMTGVTDRELKKAYFRTREVEIIRLMCQGKTIKEIANVLHIVPKTVEAHRKDLYTKTKTFSQSTFIIYAIRKGLNYLR